MESQIVVRRGSFRARISNETLGALLLFGIGLGLHCHVGLADTPKEAQVSSPPANSFYRLPRYSRPALSPSGKYLASRVTVNSEAGFLITALKTDEKPILLGIGKG